MPQKPTSSSSKLTEASRGPELAEGGGPLLGTGTPDKGVFEAHPGELEA